MSDERTLVTQTIIVKLLRGGLLCQGVGGWDWQREFTVGSRCGAKLFRKRVPFRTRFLQS